MGVNKTGVGRMEDKLEIRRLKTITKKCVKEAERLAKAARIKNAKMKAEIFGVLLLAELQRGDKR